VSSKNKKGKKIVMKKESGNKTIKRPAAKKIK
jgi:hypothetical protein